MCSSLNLPTEFIHLFIASRHVTKQAIDGSSISSMNREQQRGRPKVTEGGPVYCAFALALVFAIWILTQMLNQRKPLITESLKWMVVRAPTTVASISPPLHRTSQMRNVSVVHQSRLVSTVKWARQWAYSWTGHPLDLYHPKKGLLWR